MNAFQQIIFGTGLLTLSAILHVTVIAFSVPMLGWLSRSLPGARWLRLRILAFLAFALFVLVFGHTVQVWIWAATFLVVSDLTEFPASFYFATVTYTTLGYGDIVLGPGARILATFCAITGLLAFGLSTAFLIGVLSRVMPGFHTDDTKP